MDCHIYRQEYRLQALGEVLVKIEKSDLTQISPTKHARDRNWDVLPGIRCAALYLESSQQTNSERSNVYVKCSHLLRVSSIYIIDRRMFDWGTTDV